MSCPICLERLVSATEAVVSTPCGHLFHESCLRGAADSRVQWSDLNGTCPTCRSPVRMSEANQESNTADGAQADSYPAIRRVYISPSADESSDGRESLASLRAQLLCARETASEWVDERRHFMEELAAAERKVKILEGKLLEARRLEAELAETKQRFTNLAKKQERSLKQLLATSNALGEERALRLASQAALKVFLQEAEEEKRKRKDEEAAKQQQKRGTLGETLRRGLGGLVERKKKLEEPTLLDWLFVDDNRQLPASQFSPRVTARLIELRRADGSELNVYVAAS